VPNEDVIAIVVKHSRDSHAPTTPTGRRRERRATRRGRDPDACFSAKRLPARDVDRGGDLGAGRAQFCACFHAIAQARVVGLTGPRPGRSCLNRK
jgi:hypothetical protein